MVRNLCIHRATHASSSTKLPNEAVRDDRLSWKARGVHHYILSCPDAWRTNIAHLVRQSDKDGRDAVKSALKELESLGYLGKGNKSVQEFNSSNQEKGN